MYFLEDQNTIKQVPYYYVTSNSDELVLHRTFRENGETSYIYRLIVNTIVDPEPSMMDYFLTKLFG